MPATTQTRKIIVKVDTSDAQGLRDIADRLGLLNKNTKSLSDNMRLLKNSFLGWVAALGVREIARISDQMQNLENRLKIITTDGKDSADVLDQIREIAKRTYQPITDVAEAYTRMGSALKSTGATTEQLGALTETLVNTFRVAGTTVTETTNTMIQLSQAFSSGQLRGQELRSVLEQNATLAGYLRKEFGKDIFKKAADGIIQASTVTKVLINNFDELQGQASKLTPTFEQGVSNAMTDFSVAVNKVNKDLGLSIIFFKSLAAVVDNAGAILAGVAAGALTYFISTIGSLTGVLKTLYTATVAFLTTNPFGWAIIAATAVGTLVYSLGGLANTLDYIKIGALYVYEGFLQIEKAMGRLTGSTKLIEDANKELANTDAAINKILKDIEARNAEKGLTEEQKRNQLAKEQLKLLYERQKAYEGAIPKEQKIKEILGEINKAYLEGNINLKQYNDKLINFELYKVNREFKEGKYNIFEYNKRLQALEVQQLSRDLKDGAISLNQFNDEVTGSKIDLLNDKFEEGKITLVEYNTELAKLSQEFLPGSALVSGTASYIQSIGTLSDNIAKGITQTFSHLEDNLVEFIKNGSFNFSKFAQAILDDLTRIIVRASIVRPLAEGILNGFVGGGGEIPSGGAGASSPLSFAAKGMGFDKGIRKFASGGIVDRPTAFRYGAGRVGIMGEAGSEAILPLKRGSDGNLGVASAPSTPVIVNIMNKTDSEIKQSEKSGPNGERVLEIMIQQKVRDGLASGAFDKQLQSDFGLKRKGS